MSPPNEDIPVDSQKSRYRTPVNKDFKAFTGISNALRAIKNAARNVLPTKKHSHQLAQLSRRLQEVKTDFLYATDQLSDDSEEKMPEEDPVEEVVMMRTLAADTEMQVAADFDPALSEDEDDEDMPYYEQLTQPPRIGGPPMDEIHFPLSLAQVQQLNVKSCLKTSNKRSREADDEEERSGPSNKHQRTASYPSPSVILRPKGFARSDKVKQYKHQRFEDGIASPPPERRNPKMYRRHNATWGLRLPSNIGLLPSDEGNAGRENFDVFKPRPAIHLVISDTPGPVRKQLSANQMTLLRTALRDVLEQPDFLDWLVHKASGGSLIAEETEVEASQAAVPSTRPDSTATSSSALAHESLAVDCEMKPAPAAEGEQPQGLRRSARKQTKKSHR